jgi:DNA-binding protein HU-beta
MTKDELITLIASETKLTKKIAKAVVQAFVTAIHDSLSQKDGSIRISDLGTFRVAQRKARIGANPRTGKKMQIPAMNIPRFSPSKALKAAVKGAK